jgi:hypothetical protein
MTTLRMISWRINGRKCNYQDRYHRSDHVQVIAWRTSICTYLEDSTVSINCKISIESTWKKQSVPLYLKKGVFPHQDTSIARSSTMIKYIYLVGIMDKLDLMISMNLPSLHVNGIKLNKRIHLLDALQW